MASSWTESAENKQRFWLSVAGIAIVAVVAIGLVHKNDERKYQSLANQNQAQVTRLKYSGEIQTALNDQKWSEAQKPWNGPVILQLSKSVSF